MKTKKTKAKTINYQGMERTKSTKNIVDSRYMNSFQKRYYLASTDENIQLLVNTQKRDLTKVLIDLKSEYDKLTCETSIKKKETLELQKKISMLEQMDNKIKKKFDVSKNSNETMKDAIEVKKKKKEEALYTKRTFEKQIEKLQTDLSLIEEEIIKKENKTIVLDKAIEKERIKENDIKLRYNKTYSNILEMNKQNKFDKNEQDLQILYYETIIDQKNNFILAADERKNRQKKIAAEAKNDSNDKQEVEKRRELALVMLYNTYLRHKMEELLTNNKKVEDVYEEIHLICGNNDLSDLVEFLMNKEKNYNLALSYITGYEKEKERLEKEHKYLYKKYIELSTKIPISGTAEDTLKDTTTLETKLNYDTRSELEQKEKELEDELIKLQEKHKNISLSYEKIVENINSLLTFHTENYSHLSPQEMKEEQPELIAVQEQSKNVENVQDLQSQKLKEVDTNANDKGLSTFNYDTTAPFNNKTEKDNQINTQNIPIDVQVTPEQTEIINKYNSFIDKTLKSFDILFLCHSKSEFLDLMRDKGIEIENDNQKISHKNARRPLKKKTKLESRIKEVNPFDKDFENDDDDNIENNKDNYILKDFTYKEWKAKEDFIGDKQNKLPQIKKRDIKDK